MGRWISSACALLVHVPQVALDGVVHVKGRYRVYLKLFPPVFTWDHGRLILIAVGPPTLAAAPLAPCRTATCLPCPARLCLGARTLSYQGEP